MPRLRAAPGGIAPGLVPGDGGSRGCPGSAPAGPGRALPLLSAPGRRGESCERSARVFAEVVAVLLGSGCARSGADTALLAGKWSAFAERADSVTGHSGAAGPPGRLSGHVGGMGDARSHRCCLNPFLLAPGSFRGICVIGTKCSAFFFFFPLSFLSSYFFPPVFFFFFFLLFKAPELQIYLRICEYRS